MLVTLIALWRLGADAARPPGWAPLHACASRGLGDLARALDSRTPPSPLPALWPEAHRVSSRLAARGGPHDALMAREVERLAWQVGALRTAVARLIAASSPDR